MFVTANQCQGHGNMLLLWYHLNKQNPFELKGHLQGANNRKHYDNEIKIWKVNQNYNAIWHNLHLRNFTCVFMVEWVPHHVGDSTDGYSVYLVRPE